MIVYEVSDNVDCMLVGTFNSQHRAAAIHVHSLYLMHTNNLKVNTFQVCYIIHICCILASFRLYPIPQQETHKKYPLFEVGNDKNKNKLYT